MIKTVQMNDSQSVELNSSMGWMYLYQEQFGHDVLVEVMPAIEAAINFIMTGAKAVAADGLKDAAVAALGAMDEDAVADLMIKASGLQTTTLINVLWCMAKNVDSTKQIGRPMQWVNQFDSIEWDHVAPKLFGMMLDSMISKKKSKAIKAAAKSLLSSVSRQSQSQESTEA